ncbi:hypothetical protein OESDEN_01392 [Oesophagostomum dentatum]|uniref:Reverse transcriptase RNase H-like domain-containing protein n=1 Tax=Oesophagostomum dentatum TaxID=61180 RepID=A0A0B1TM57_OESDE|nr:hypothetical protein OESDEN_01392 [Oesophagostomum dentatum]
MPQTRHLACITDKDGRHPDPEKNEVIRQMPVPKKVQEDRSFLGMSAYYCRDRCVRLGDWSSSSERNADGTQNVICLASRSLTPVEKNYGETEKEGLALIFALRKFHHYTLYGRRFKLMTDHKPLLHIFVPKKMVPVYTANGLQRWKPPAEIFLGRQIRTSLTLEKEPRKRTATRNEKMEEQFNRHHGAQEKSYQMGESVLV